MHAHMYPFYILWSILTGIEFPWSWAEIFPSTYNWRAFSFKMLEMEPRDFCVATQVPTTKLLPLLRRNIQLCKLPPAI